MFSMTRQRVSGIVIENGKILMIKDFRADFLLIPGGGIEEGETHEETLRREFEEELDVRLVSCTPLISFTFLNQVTKQDGQDHVYIATIEGKPKVCPEIERIEYVSKEDILSGNVRTSDAFRKHSLPLLLKNYLN